MEGPSKASVGGHLPSGDKGFDNSKKEDILPVFENPEAVPQLQIGWISIMWIPLVVLSDFFSGDKGFRECKKAGHISCF